MSDPLWSVVLMIGLVGWLTSALIFIFKVFPTRGEFRIQPAKRWGIAVLGAFVVWVIGLLNA